MKTTEPIQAVILVGGEGTRLRPLTYTTVKAMVPVLNKPYIEYLFEHLKTHGVNEIILAMGYKPDAIEKYFSNKSMNQTLIYSLEQTPLGTAGAVKKASVHIRNQKPFFVINGDIFTNLNFSDMYRFHGEKRAKITIALTPVEDPSRFGVVDIDSNREIHRFIEKPNRDEAPSNLINAGIYVLDPEILKNIPKDKKFMFEHDVFPKLIADRVPVYGFISDAYWTDIGTFGTYSRLNFDLLLGKPGLKKAVKKKVSIARSTPIPSGARLTGTLLIDSNCRIGENCHLKGPVIIGADNIIDNNVTIENSILWEKVQVKRNAVIKNSIIGSTICIEPDLIIENSVVSKGRQKGSIESVKFL